MSSEKIEPGPASSRRARLVDVAHEAGVSKALASRILNGERLPIRPETHDRVVAAARRLAYRPHAAARSLKRGETGALSLLLPTLTNPVFALISRGAVERALERDVAVLLIEDSEPATASELVRRLVQGGRIDGAIVASMQPEHPLPRTLELLGIPHVFVHRTVPGSNRNVSMDDQKASALAVDYLARLGHRFIAHVAGPRLLTTTQRLVEGFSARAAELGVRHVVVGDDFSEPGGARAAEELFDLREPPTAIYTGSLTQAVGVLHVAFERGLRVPDDFSLIASGELTLANFLNPPLTSISVPLAELGAAAVDALVGQLRGDEPRDVVVETHPEVIVRSSAARPPDPTGAGVRAP
ncbi:MAG TPA: LacI family DNA-binding transcriptional regulator [Plantibacter sp.]|uniref:LacI family DNA-binding transcriptional regulator n=1 Tax=Plantibacter sp. TaxID=1871045 RepID=UPI002BFA27C7|nr:LacI family DNA-binding transcriptional regulator [Plantibacter sp.]